MEQQLGSVTEEKEEEEKVEEEEEEEEEEERNNLLRQFMEAKGYDVRAEVTTTRSASFIFVKKGFRSSVKLYDIKDHYPI